MMRMMVMMMMMMMIADAVTFLHHLLTSVFLAQKLQA